MGRLYVHCGLHKTGTTALQEFLAEEAETLAANGVLYPRAGRPGAAKGQHNLAWQLTRDRRFRPHYGDLQAVAEEIAGHVGDVVLSSEDFESLLLIPDGLKPLAELAAASGRTLAPVLYIRNQADYLQSLYYECLKIGIAEDFEGFFSEVLERGEVRRRDWRFVFDFGGAVERLSGLEGCEVRVRNYHVLEGGTAARDFLSVIEMPSSLFSEASLSRRAQEREALIMAMARFYGARMRRELSPREREAVRLMGEALDAAAPAPPAERQLADAFRFSNRELCRRHQMPEDGLVWSPPPRTTAADLAKVFSLETQLAIQRLAEQLSGPDARRATAEADAWRAWLQQA